MDFDELPARAHEHNTGQHTPRPNNACANPSRQAIRNPDCPPAGQPRHEEEGREQELDPSWAGVGSIRRIGQVREVNQKIEREPVRAVFLESHKDPGQEGKHDGRGVTTAIKTQPLCQGRLNS